MDHLHVVPRPAVADPLAAGDIPIGTDLRGDRLENIFHQRPGLRIAAGHQARPAAGPFLTAGNPGSDEADPLRLEELRPALGIFELGVSAVDNHVARIQQGEQLLDHRVDRGRLGIELGLQGGDGVLRLDHQHHLAGALELANQLLQRMRPGEMVPLRFGLVGGEEIVHLAGGSVKDRHVEPMVDHIEHQVLPHHRQPHQADIVLFLTHCFVRASGLVVG